jgi:hypothetical protein
VKDRPHFRRPIRPLRPRTAPRRTVVPIATVDDIIASADDIIASAAAGITCDFKHGDPVFDEMRAFIGRLLDFLKNDGDPNTARINGLLNVLLDTYGAARDISEAEACDALSLIFLDIGRRSRQAALKQ